MYACARVSGVCTCVYVYVDVRKRQGQKGGQMLVFFSYKFTFFCMEESKDLFLIKNRACANWLLTFSFAYLSCSICR